MIKMSFEKAQSLYNVFMVDRIHNNLVYHKTLGALPVPSFEEWLMPDMYYIDGINKKELPHRLDGESFYSHQIETFNEWYKKI